MLLNDENCSLAQRALDNEAIAIMLNYVIINAFKWKIVVMNLDDERQLAS